MDEPDQTERRPAELPELPLRELRDTQVLRALAHPVRLRLIEELALLGTATATQLAERIDESPANCSWHLRQLAKHGFVEEADGGTGRQRPWRVVPQSTTFGRFGDDDAELARAEDAASQVLLGWQLQALTDWQRRQRTEPTAWRDAGMLGQSFTWLTAGELAAFRDDYNELIERHVIPTVERLDPAKRPPGSRAVRIVGWAIPGPAETEAAGEAGSEHGRAGGGDRPDFEPREDGNHEH